VDELSRLRLENERLTKELAVARENYEIVHNSWKGLHWQLDQIRGFLSGERAKGSETGHA
jgi:hypothetical protein